ncbi:OLC1v1007275C1 [Oldenlandia corymbosa var. corymbosa]|uniref:OLC1v1007275C1 n=1 Tax=Oldenlandia corymbosa var. corymbosa TaxID=529605 RepID=A0AAV1DLI3_OLDCO|nr:OLC1v1007275C1 [Oldenlandia corymbosa var. corymbosa]
MADQHTKIHPLKDKTENPQPTRPLVPKGSSFKSDNQGQPSSAMPSNVHVQNNPPSFPFMDLRRASKPKRSCWCRCICWTISLLILLLIILGFIVAVIYIVFQPKIPNYSVDNLRISDLRLNFDLSLYARFNVRITAYNPNKKIGIYYEKGSQLSVWYKSSKLCQGPIPKFYQGHQNRTKLDVALTGQSQYGNTLLSALQEAQQTGRIPLDLKINVPVRIELGNLKLKKVRIVGNCALIVDSLSTNSFISIKASTCKFNVKL